MIIKVYNKPDNKLSRILISVTILLAIFSYYAYYISYKIDEYKDDKTFKAKAGNIAKKRKESRKLQRSILDEAEKVVSLVGANHIEKIRFSKTYLNIMITNDIIVESLAARYGKMAKIEKSGDIWRVELNMQKLLTLKREETLKIK